MSKKDVFISIIEVCETSREHAQKCINIKELEMVYVGLISVIMGMCGGAIAMEKQDDTCGKSTGIGTNRYGVDIGYFRKELLALAENLENKTPEELCRHLGVLSKTASKD